MAPRWSGKFGKFGKPVGLFPPTYGAELAGDAGIYPEFLEFIAELL
jgi:hypothetical protein